MRLRLATLIFAILALAVGTWAQTGKEDKSLPVLHLDIHSNVKGPDPVAQAFLSPIMNQLNEYFEVRPGPSTKAEQNFEIRMFFVARNGQTAVTTIVVAKFRNEPILAYLGSETVLIDKNNAEGAGNAVLEAIGKTIDDFIDQANAAQSKEH